MYSALLIAPQNRVTPLARIGQIAMVLLTPPLLILIAVRLVMSPVFLHIEYTRPGFPVDPYGLTTEDRLRYAPKALDYLIYNQPLEALASLTFDDGTALYNTRELGHMHDVQQVTQLAFLSALLGGIAFTALAMLLGRSSSQALGRALHGGGLLTLVLIAAIVVFSVAAWDRFFVLFHSVFFADGTWTFPYSDTLIRLFPEQFWFDAAITIGGMTIIGGVLLLLIGARLYNQPFRG
jgi:integral membrane protein (TIGR01906 family)